MHDPKKQAKRIQKVVNEFLKENTGDNGKTWGSLTPMQLPLTVAQKALANALGSKSFDHLVGKEGEGVSVIVGSKEHPRGEIVNNSHNNLWVAVITHKYGTYLCPAFTEEGAYKGIHDYLVENWRPDISEEHPVNPPDDVHKAIDLWFGPDGAMADVEFYDVGIYNMAAVEATSIDQNPRVRFCPYCGHQLHMKDVAVWPAYSEDDPDNKAELDENQCQNCSMSFWT